MCWPPKPLESHASYLHVKISYFLFPLVCLWSFNFPKNSLAPTFSFLPFLMTIVSYEPLWPDLCKGALDYRRKYTAFSEISEISLAEMWFLPSLRTCQVMPWATAWCKLGKQCSPEQSSCPLLTSSSCSALRNQSGRRGSCYSAQWVSWCSSLLSHKGSSWHETGHRLGTRPGDGEEMTPFSPGQCRLICALRYCLLACGPSIDPSSCGCICTTFPIEKLLFFYSHGKKPQNSLNKFPLIMGRKSLGNLHPPSKLNFFCSAVSSTTPILLKEYNLVVQLLLYQYISLLNRQRCTSYWYNSNWYNTSIILIHIPWQIKIITL